MEEAAREESLNPWASCIGSLGEDPTISASPNRAASEDAYYEDLERSDLAPLWRIITQTREPTTRVETHIWRWKEIYPKLLRAGEIMRPSTVQAEGAAERRVLVFVNPGLKEQKAATNTLVAAIQLIFPGEVAPAHRHTPIAVRFILKGRGAYTTVDGERVVMHPGDLILTPNGTWHDHGNESTEPVVWFDGLDRLLVQHLDAVFSDPHPTGKQELIKPIDYSSIRYGPSAVRPVWEQPAPSPTTSPQICYRWEATAESLRRLADLGESGPFGDVAVAYTNPETGSHALSTVGCVAQLLTPGSRTRARRNTGSAVYVVKDGAGSAVMNGVRFEWEQGDIFVLPPWAWYELSNASGSDEAFLFQLNDHPVFQALGLFREQAYEEHGGHQAVIEEMSEMGVEATG